MKTFKASVTALLISAAFALGGCGIGEEYDARTDKEINEDIFADHSKRPTIFGEGGFSVFGDSASEGAGELGVNSFLWRATLDTISFMPVNSADPFGGVVITDWHSSADSPNERFKLNIYILGRTLRADGVRVAVFRQVLTRNGQWRDSAVPDDTRIKIEDAILTRARQMRNASLITK